ncbi:deazaflavin-dependent oxidoreductase, nitroreductase family [Actinokineospora alba]|uniref:Deazaflavin-dependent oxidoreductase, nitroreductase family n=1 Tax=Actinokineospora alba TaxID=504798 RepID=A0A1H0QN68_9PSEU|nr:nitroreductase family deazaflavin-dependent oxidoreductase [Actinokineospora alba]TDP70494.1 deazaflavin-dependent oxidoreductase (nitroreductase family) [Actinokineospora alba]SDI30084.1 deazaflavin-dependent oxidoreductase, nitroreductase family [Actinokineospora alba]SDP18186.1 deazaflavin-dependent oxidoreductase, nitroreductase family [Actinokineospora alba]
MTEITDSSTGWVARHIQRYVETDGADGYLFNGYPTLLLTTRGRKSGQLRRTALIFGESDGRYLLVASNGGAVKHPAWYLNLAADPEVTVQIRGEVFAARARTATPEEKPELWAAMVEVFPTYASYQRKSPRDIPVVVLERV